MIKDETAGVAARELPSDLAFALPAGPGRRAKRWLVPGGPGTIRSLSVADDGTCAIAYEAHRYLPDSDCEVQVRSGDDLGTLVARYRSLRAPATLTRDGRRLAAAETTPDDHPRTALSPGIRVIEVGNGGRGVHWPLDDRLGWSPTGETLVALTRSPYQRPPVTDPVVLDAAVDALLGLEDDADAHVVVADVAQGRVTALDRHRVLDGTGFRGTHLVLTGDGAVAVAYLFDYGVYDRAVGFSVATGEMLWSQPPLTEERRLLRQSCRAAAVSRCGRLVAFAGSDLDENANLVVLDAATGRVLLALNTKGLGSDKAPNALCFHPTGWLAVGFGDGRVSHLSMTGSSTTYRAVSRAISALAVTADGARLLVGSGDPRGLCAVDLTPAEQHPFDQAAQ